MAPKGYNLHRLLQVILCMTVVSLCVIWFTTGGLSTATRLVVDSEVDESRVQDGSSSKDHGPSTSVPPLRIMFVGDSITHGNEGDFTWRFRLHQWLQSQNVNHEFVGPFVGTYRPPDAEPPTQPLLYGEKKAEREEANTNGTYASTFDSRHFAIAGRPASFVKGLIKDVAADHPADIMLVLLGFNDMKVFQSIPAVLLHDMLSLITNARRSCPKAKFVLGTVPQVSKIWQTPSNTLVDRTEWYSELLKVHAPGWSEPESPVYVADVKALYDCGPQYEPDCPAGFDGLHPNELGEYQIAQAFSRALVTDLNIGETPILEYDAPKRKMGVPSNFTLMSSPQGVTATWDRVYGAYSYDVNVNKSSEPGKSPVGTTRANRWDSDNRFARDGLKYYVRVRSKSGFSRTGEWTEWREAIAHPQIPPPPTNITAYGTDSGLDISWKAPESEFPITEYNIKYQHCDTTAMAAFNGTSARLDKLQRGGKYVISIESWSSGGAGYISPSQEVIAGYRNPGLVKNLKVRSASATVAQLTWDEVEGAAGYMVYRRNTQDPQKELVGVDANPVKVNCFTSGMLYPGVSVYEWVVSAVNGAAEGRRSSPVVAMKADGSKIRECPKPSSTCVPAGSGQPRAKLARALMINS